MCACDWFVPHACRWTMPSADVFSDKCQGLVFSECWWVGTLTPSAETFMPSATITLVNSVMLRQTMFIRSFGDIMEVNITFTKFPHSIIDIFSLVSKHPIWRLLVKIEIHVIYTHTHTVTPNNNWHSTPWALLWDIYWLTLRHYLLTNHYSLQGTL